MRALPLAVLLLSLAACGSKKSGLCDACGEGTLCDTNTGRCVAKNNPPGPSCTPSCSGARPVCDQVTNPQNPRCVQCVTSADCAGGGTCSSNQACLGGTGGGSGGGGGGGGSSGTGGGSGGSGGFDGGTGGTGGGGSVSTYDAGTYTGIGSCAPQDAGTPGGSCVPACMEGFSCLSNSCVLNGGNGPVQVTLRWNTTEDFDLHLREPLGTGSGTCEIDYTDPNQPGDPSSCGALGSLDLDSEAGCSVDHVDIENIIYPPGSTPRSGVYSVFVDHYANCNPALTLVPFELEARFNGNTVGLCGAFQPTDPDWDNANATSGRPVLQFTLP